jgi:hypothetical protein
VDKNKLKYFLCVLLIRNIYLNGVNLPLPASISTKPVYYEKVEQLKDMSCGYNALFNACKIEKRLGRDNLNNDFNRFKNICLSYLKTIGRDPKASATNNILEDLGKQLGLQRIHYLNIDNKNNIMPVFSTPIKVTYFAGTPKQEVNRLLEEAMKKRVDNLWISLKREMDRSSNTFFIHFLCHMIVDGEGHAILASVVKNSQGRKALYIFDNMNNSITEYSPQKKYIDHLCSKLNIVGQGVKISNIKYFALGSQAEVVTKK